MGNQEVFDGEARYYDSWYETKLGAFADEVETKLAFDMYTPEEESLVLDAGCGTGNFTFRLLKKGCRVVGIDISEDMLKKAREKAQKKDLSVAFHQMDMYQLDFADESFDAVFSMATFEFIKEPQKAYQELYRVLKPQGKLLIGTIHKDSPWGAFYASLAKQKETVFEHADFKSTRDIEALNKEELLELRECLFIPPQAEESMINWEEEKRREGMNRGGFFCALWKKGLNR